MRPVIRRFAIVACAAVLVLLTSAPDLAAPSGATPARAASGIRELALGTRHLDVRRLSTADPSRSTRPAPRLPRLTRSSSTTPRLPSTVLAAPPINAATTTAAAPLVANAFAGLDDQNFGACSSPNCLEPPDPWVAVGPSDVVQVVNLAIRITDRSGGNAATYDLDPFFAVQAGLSPTAFALGDTRILYDAYQRRWVGVQMAVDCTFPGNGGNPAGFELVAVSDTADPRGSWTIWGWGVTGGFPDYPGLGTSRDKIVVSGNVFELGTGSGTSCLNIANPSYAGAKLYAFDWPLSTYSRLPASGFDATVFAWRPASEAPAIATDATVYLVGIGASNQVIYGALTGTPSGAPLSWSLSMTKLDLAAAGVLAPNNDPPVPAQPGSPGTLGQFAVDSRLTDAVWQNGKLWFVSTYGCRPTGQVAATIRDCVRVTKLQTNGSAAPTRLGDFLLQAPDRDTYMGGIGVDGNGSLHVVYSRSSTAAGDYISSAAVYQRPTDPAGAVSQAVQIAAGAGTYTLSDGRWGDYVGVAFDPVNSSSVWQADEYANASGGWSTKVARLVVPKDVTRLSGTDRYATSAAISATTFQPGVNGVFIATGRNFPDALAGGPAAIFRGDPVLLVDGLAASIPGGSPVERELRRLKPAKIFILGSSGAVSNGIQAQLAGYVAGGASQVFRVAGANRYDTAARIAQTYWPGLTNPHVYIATGLNFPDALAAAPAAGLVQGRLLLVATNSIPAETAHALSVLAPTDITIVGGPTVVSDGVRAALKAYVGNDPTRVHRLAGSDRYGTAIAISQASFKTPPYWVYVATGLNYPDALAGAAISGANAGPIILVGSSITTAEATELTRLKPPQIDVFGGPTVVSEAIRVALRAYLK